MNYDRLILSGNIGVTIMSHLFLTREMLLIKPGDDWWEIMELR